MLINVSFAISLLPSMDKLFDLMLMGFKYQVQCSLRLEQMLEVRFLGAEIMSKERI